MHFKEVVKQIAQKTDFTRKDVEIILKVYSDIIKENVMTEEIPVHGIGKFLPKERSARKIVNPQTKENMDIPPCTVPSFKMYPSLVKDLKVVE